VKYIFPHIEVQSLFFVSLPQNLHIFIADLLFCIEFDGTIRLISIGVFSKQAILLTWILYEILMMRQFYSLYYMGYRQKRRGLTWNTVE